MVFLQNDDTRADRPPSDVTAAPALCTKLQSSPKGCFRSLDRYI